MIKATINGISVEVPVGTTILEAAAKVQVRIPTLCKHPDLDATAACGICVVKVKGSAKLPRACCTPVEHGMEVITHDSDIVQIRRTVVELIASRHPNSCLTCGRNRTCELQALAADFGLRMESFPNITPDIPVDNSTGTIVMDAEKCISCGRCVNVCQNLQQVYALCFTERGFSTRITAAGVNLGESPCVGCGQCAAHCPTGALFEFDETAAVWDLLRDPDVVSVVQIAPAVRVALGDAFGFRPGTNVTGKIYSALRRMGFRHVFDTNFGADVTIMEEATELLERLLKGKGKLPLITSCCPAWVDYLEKMHGDLVDHFSTCKSPHAIVGALTKTYFAHRSGIDPSTLKVVSIMPCTAKKWEIRRDDTMRSSGFDDIDVSITTRELARMIKQAGIDFASLPDDTADSILGDYTGAGTIFGVTGGVMEAALRTAAEFATGTPLAKIEFESVRGLQGVKESVVNIGGHELRLAVAHGLGHVGTVLQRVREALAAGTETPYHFIEVMACPGGCVGGGGQPYGITDAVREARGKGLYGDDERCTLRCSHENPEVQILYKEFLTAPLSHRAHELLHTRYTPRPKYVR
jgi:NADH-quinone oxidoreductase subunit G